MIFTTDLPALKVYIEQSYLTADQLHGLEEAYLVGVKSQANHPLKFTVHLETGGLWSGLPIEAISLSRDLVLSYDTTLLQPFSCLEGNIQVIEYKYLQKYQVHAMIDGKLLPGLYYCTIDYCGSGLTDDPEQFKTHNLILLDGGQIAALPNNMCLFTDHHFTKSSEPVIPRHYSRSSDRYYTKS